MKRFNKIMVALVVSVALLTSSIVLAQGWGSKGNKGPRFAQQQQAFPGPGRVLRTEMYNARVEVLADLSGLSQDDIKAKLQYKPMWAVLDEVEVEFPTFQTKMHEKAKTVVTQAVADGKLTKEQGDYMLKRMEDGPRQGMGPRGGGRGKGRGFGGGNGGGNRWN